MEYTSLTFKLNPAYHKFPSYQEMSQTSNFQALLLRSRPAETEHSILNDFITHKIVISFQYCETHD